MNSAILNDDPNELLLFAPLIRFLNMYISSKAVDRDVFLYRGGAFPLGSDMKMVKGEVFRQPMVVAASSLMEIASNKTKPGSLSLSLSLSLFSVF